MTPHRRRPDECGRTATVLAAPVALLLLVGIVVVASRAQDGGVVAMPRDARPALLVTTTAEPAPRRVPTTTHSTSSRPGPWETALRRLDPALASALRRAAADAGEEGVQLRVNSGRRSVAEQERLLREAVARYGSEEEAERWVATPETSAHVSGDAVDIGPTAGASWLARHGSRYGLCQIYRNEPWHVELRPAAVDSGCPAMYADPTQDPRMRR